jgi:hypothetical protein
MQTEILNYPHLPLVRGESYGNVMASAAHNSWTKSESVAFLDWYKERGARSTVLLREFLCPSLPEYNEAGIFELSDALRRLVAFEAFGEESPVKTLIVGLGQGRHIELDNSGRILSEVGLSIVFDMATYFGSTLLKEHPHLAYEIVQTRRKVKDADEGLPAIYGFPKSVHLYPPRVVTVAASKMLNGSAKDEYGDAYRFWSALAKTP